MKAESLKLSGQTPIPTKAPTKSPSVTPTNCVDDTSFEVAMINFPGEMRDCKWIYWRNIEERGGQIIVAMAMVMAMVMAMEMEMAMAMAMVMLLRLVQ